MGGGTAALGVRVRVAHHWCCLLPRTAVWSSALYVYVYIYLNANADVLRGGGGHSGPLSYMF